MYLAEILKESKKRKYFFKENSIIDTSRLKKTIKVTEGQLEYELKHLLNKLSKRNTFWFSKINKIRNPEPNLLFTAVKGNIEFWEKIPKTDKKQEKPGGHVMNKFVSNERKAAFMKYSVLIFVICIFLVSAANALTPAPASGQQGSLEKKIFILTYHRFSGASEFDIYDFSIEKFLSQINILKKYGVNFITCEDFINNRSTAAVSVLISIDDPDQTAYRVYLQVLKPLNIKPLFAVNPYSTDKKTDVLSWNQVTELISDSCTVAMRGTSNSFIPMLTDNVLYPDNNEMIKDIMYSKSKMENETGQKLYLYVYPRGIRLPVVKQTIKQAGYKFAFIMKKNFAEYPIYDEFAIPRYLVSTSNWKDIFTEIIKCNNKQCRQIPDLE
jgi:hypothetical protein